MQGIFKFVLRICLFGILALLVLEALVRIFHLYKDTPDRMIDNKQVEKYQPNQSGYSVTGNRRQNISAYRINGSGFNSFREFTPGVETTEVALVGDSFIEGFHEDYQNSLGKQIEEEIPGLQVYEYGYAGYDLADELHLIHAYADSFKNIDYVFIYLRFEDDLRRGSYEVVYDRVRLDEGFYRVLKKSKLIVYIQNIGLLRSLRNSIVSFKNTFFGSSFAKTMDSEAENENVESRYLKNFHSLLNEYPINPDKHFFLLDGRIAPKSLIQYMESKGISYVDFGVELEKADGPTTLIYDQHWSPKGRKLVVKSVCRSLSDLNNK